jgi:membrane protein implicated in regulation of membrane protease activity
LADSLASFVEDSASMPVAAAQVRSQGPWMLTFGVLAADVVVLTYMHRKSVKRRMRSSSSLLQPAM